ncbi:MAG: MarR family transcriptional regulator [Ilumatobacteraceae bacterium]
MNDDVDIDIDPIELTVKNWEDMGWKAGNHLRAAMSIVRAEQILNRHGSAILKPYGVRYTRHNVLILLYFTKRGQMPLGRISEHLLVHPASITAAVDALEKDGYIERIPHPTDRRATLAAITPAGREVVVRSTTALADAHPFGLEGLTDDEARTLFELIRKVRIAAGDLPA